MRTKKGHPVKDPLFEKSHPRDARGRFRKLTDSERAERGWLGKVSRAAAPEVNRHKPRPGDLPGNHDSIASLVQSGDLKVRRLGGPKPTDQLHAYFATHGAFHDEKTGLRARPMVEGGIWLRQGGDAGFRVKFEILDKNGRRVGKAKRSFIASPDGKTALALHELMEIKDKRLRGGGFASRWNQHMEDLYRANGISEIHLEANIDVGGYAWAKQGYDFYDFDTLKLLIRNRARLEPHASDPAIAKLIARSTRQNWDKGTAPTPLEWAMAGWTEGAQTWPGKQLMLGSSWTGVKKL